jgi:hypothetical protein
MNEKNNQLSDQVSRLAYKFFVFDTFLNWILGILFIFFYRLSELLISGSTLLPDILWIIIGIGLLLFGFWQTYIVLMRKFNQDAQLYSCIMAWISFLILTYALVFMRFEIYTIARLVIWTGNLYMFVLGCLYLLSYRKLKQRIKI